ncbi:MAG: sugar dehydrogenase complex small subunit [Thermomicrobiales bacterium]
MTTNRLTTASLDRRRLLGAIAGGALIAALRAPGALAQSTPAAASLDALTSLSARLCGGGTFSPEQTAQLAALLASDPDLANGLEELLAKGSDSASTPAAPARSANATAAAQAILLYWYTGSFKGEPVEHHAAIYSELQAWQAMYTPSWATCKVYGAWADPPTMTPQEPELA